MKRFILIFFSIFLLSSCNTDYINNTMEQTEKNISSPEIYSMITKDLTLPNLKSLNDSELLNLYSIDPKLLLDYVSNISNDNISGVEISIFRLKDAQNNTEVILGIQERIKHLENDYKLNKQNQYYLIKNPYIKIFNNYIVFVLHEDIKKVETVLNSIFN